MMGANIKISSAKEWPGIEERDLLILPAPPGPDALYPLPGRWKGRCEEAIDWAGFDGKTGKEVFVWPGRGAPAVLIVGIGDDDSDRARAIIEAGARGAAMAKSLGAGRILVPPLGDDLPPLVRGVEAAFSRAAGKAGEGKKTGKAGPPRVLLVRPKREGLAMARRLISGIGLARELVDLPPEEKSPRAAALFVRRRLSGLGVRTRLLERAALKRERCGGILAVGKGSSRFPAAMRISYRPKRPRGHIALVGKGLCFDSGGLNIKPHQSMLTMKSDLAGAAAVSGAVAAAAGLGLPVSLTAWLGFAENLPGPLAYKQGDIVKTRSGRTVEIEHTDAEGRVLMADLLDLAKDEKPDLIIDIATLTGACMVALGEETAGLFGTDERILSAIEAAAIESGEPVWRLPLGRDHERLIKGDRADLKNSGGRWGGASTAAQFLRSFTGDIPWAHIDIAGPSFREKDGPGRPGGGTGFGTALLVSFIRRFASNRRVRS